MLCGIQIVHVLCPWQASLTAGQIYYALCICHDCWNLDWTINLSNLIVENNTVF